MEGTEDLSLATHDFAFLITDESTARNDPWWEIERCFTTPTLPMRALLYIVIFGKRDFDAQLGLLAYRVGCVLGCCRA
jgi:hypothetical protein